MKLSPTQVTMLAQMLSKEFKSYKTLNYGGCGFFALELMERLRKLGISCHAVTNTETDGKNNQMPKLQLHSVKNRDGSWGHVGLKIGDVILDSDGIVDYSMPVTIYVNTLKWAVGQLDRWNSKFNRRYYAKRIQNKLDKVVMEFHNYYTTHEKTYT